MATELTRKIMQRRIDELREQEDAACDLGNDDAARKARALRYELEDALAVLKEEVAQ